jgi:hypothetical protein
MIRNSHTVRRILGRKPGENLFSSGLNYEHFFS